MLNKIHEKIDWSLIRNLVEKHGAEAQMLQAQEELAEAIVAISHWRRGRKGSACELPTEISHAIFMIAQVLFIIGSHDIIKNLECTQEKAKKILSHSNLHK